MDETDTQGQLSNEIQGNVLRGWTFPHARFAFVEVQDAAQGRSWLGSLPIQDGAAWGGDEPAQALMVALSHRGLASLGVHPQLLDQFSPAFRTGMRGRLANLGDADDMSAWDPLFRYDHDRIHVLLALYGDDPASLDAQIQAWTSQPGVALVPPVQEAKTLEGREHFGFRDGISQPIQGHGTDGWISKDGVPLGEFLIFPSRWNGGASPASAKGLALGGLGTYLVFRKLHQDVRAFRAFVKGRPLPPDTAAAKMIGRWANGTPLTKWPTAPSTVPEHQADNTFDYGDDTGQKCPFGAHISRANPRQRLPTKLREHRILRRGIPYGDPLPGWGESFEGPLPDDQDDPDRGLLFIALNASLEEQFEFLQKSWINEPTFLEQDGSDPISSTLHPSELGKFRASPSLYPWPLESFVTLKGGEYFFVPSMQARADLASGVFLTP